MPASPRHAPCAPELAVAVSLPQDHPLALSLASQLLEQGLWFTGIEDQTLPGRLPERLGDHRAVLLDEDLFGSIEAARGEELRRLAEFAGKGFVFGLENSSIAGISSVQRDTKFFMDVITSSCVYNAITHAGLTRYHPEAFRAQDARPTEQIIGQIKAKIVRFMATSRRWHEYTLHYWKPAIALLRNGHEELRQPLIDSILAMSATPMSSEHHDRVAGFFATAWLLDETGRREPFEAVRREMDDVIRRGPRTEGLIGPAGRVDDPLWLERGGRPWSEAGTTVRRDVVWTETLHMHGGVLGALARVTGDRRYLDEALKYVAYLRNVHLDSDGLLWHCTRKGKPVSAKWTRGNSHAIYGMVYLLDEIPRGTSERGPVEDLIRTVLRGLKRCQDPATGLWRNVLDHPGARVESSGTTGFAVACARGIRDGWLDREEFGPMLRAALRGLRRCYWREGMAANCRGTATGIEPAYYLARQQGWAPIPQFAMALAEAEGAGISIDG